MVQKVGVGRKCWFKGCEVVFGSLGQVRREFLNSKYQKYKFYYYFIEKNQMCKDCCMFLKFMVVNQRKVDEYIQIFIFYIRKGRRKNQLFG